MAQKKGHIPWNKGFTKETHPSLMQTSEKTKGKRSWSKGLTKNMNQSIKNMAEKMKQKIPWNKGLTKNTNDIIKKMSEKAKNKKGYWRNKKRPLSTCKKISLSKKGFKHSEKSKILISKNNAKTMLNKKHPLNVIIKIKKARLLQNPTFESSIEKKIQSFLIELKVPFIKHKVIDDIEHRYQCDIFMPDLNMIIECDGDYWHNYPNGSEIDKIRNKELKEKNYKLLRLWERDIKNMNITQFRSILCESYYKQIKNKGD